MCIKLLHKERKKERKRERERERKNERKKERKKDAPIFGYISLHSSASYGVLQANPLPVKYFAVSSFIDCNTFVFPVWDGSLH
jgi:hypothetical protein